MGKTFHKVVTALLALTLAGATAAAEPPRTPARGLFVKIKDSALQARAAAAGAARGAQAVSSEAELRRSHVAAVVERRLGRALPASAARVAQPAAPEVRAVTQRVHLVDWGVTLAPSDAARLAAQLEEDPDVEFVEYNVMERRLEVVPNDPRYTGQWWLKGLSSSSLGVPRVSTAWDTGAQRGVPGAPVAILDTGKTSHPDLDAKWLSGWDFVDGDADATDPGDYTSNGDCAGTAAQDSSWHGTATAGIIAAQGDNLQWVAGVHWATPVLPVRVAGKCGALISDIVAGMRWAAGLVPGVRAGQPTPAPNANPARIINLSFGGTGDCTQTYRDAINEIRSRGAVLVVAAGNEAGAVARPANCPGVIAVAAVNKSGIKTSYSNFGPQVTISTVGGDPAELGICGAYFGDGGLLTTGNSGRTTQQQPAATVVAGTSFSAPIVSGVAALMLTVNPALTVDQLVQGLRVSARPHVEASKLGTCWASNNEHCACSTAICGAGLLDAPEALRYAENPEDYTSRPWPTQAPEPSLVEACAQAKRAAGVPLDPPEASAGDGGGLLGAPWILALVLCAWAASRARDRGGRGSLPF